MVGNQYNEGRLYLNNNDFSLSAVPVAGFFPPHKKEDVVKKLVFVSYLFAPTIYEKNGADARSTYNVDLTPEGLHLTSMLQDKRV